MDHARRTRSNQTNSYAKIIAGFLIISLSFAIVGLGFLWWWYHQSQKPPLTNQTQPISIIIPVGSSTRQIANILAENQLIRSPRGFLVYTRLNHLDGKYQAGEYQFQPGADLDTLTQSLQFGTYQGISVTFIEGWRREQFAQKLAQQFGPDSNFEPQAFIDQTADLEGQLFPETYQFETEATTQDIISTLHQHHLDQMQKLTNQTNLTPSQLVILASLIEREAAKDQDLPMISGILQNRLAIGMPLQVDATMQYVKASKTCTYTCDDWWPTPLAADKELDDPINTYQYPGLPPQPIANPGLRSLQAAANPKDNDYLYYITDNSGQMHYATTLDQHNANVQKYLR